MFFSRERGAAPRHFQIHMEQSRLEQSLVRAKECGNPNFPFPLAASRSNDNAKMAKAGPCKAPSQPSVHVFSFKWLPLEPRQNLFNSMQVFDDFPRYSMFHMCI
jgi:hypothetical protein